MSLALIQGYSSAEEEEQQESEEYEFSSENEDESAVPNPRRSISYRSVVDPSIHPPPSSSSLPSAFDAFSEVSGPPQFLNNRVDENVSGSDDIIGNRLGRRRNRKEKKDLPTGAVVESKAQLVGIHERVRSDIETNHPPATSVSNAAPEGGKRVPTATNPNAEDAAELLRMCLQCGIPKTFSNQRGMVCPVCGDRPPSDLSNESKKKGSTIKDKEKNKRMKGQSSHASWKSETEMQLRQQFD